MSNAHRKILKQLGRDYGRPIQIEGRNGQGLVFKVRDRNSPDGARPLFSRENEKLKGKLFEITYSIGYNNRK